ncbi:hypothetical protein NQ317_010095 [Molorchus minor]|uniref:SFR19-like C-terminal domain-containing protein n=1 Tax=Molorchus minor TaxID=1323400 RepID=A0ABQ9JFD1_9CUCU|nr:hypothetical protein NQ317_010095 [Molorchus minor]
MRSQAGIPTLHLFGQSHELDYFSDDNDILYGSSQVLLGRATARPDVSALHSVARRKAAIITPSIVSSSTDLLDNILSSQQQFHARNSSYSVDSKGNFKIENRKNYIDVTKQNAGGRQRPNPYQNQVRPWKVLPAPWVMLAVAAVVVVGPNDELPQDYTQRTLGASYDPNPEEQNDRDDDNSSYTTPSSESDIDIYSDIETVSTSKADHSDEVDIRPPSPPRISNFTPNTGTDEDNNDSEPDMVIDDEKMLEPEKSQEYNGGRSCCVIHCAVQSSNLMDNNKHDYDEDSADGCPNTSIYSKESMDVLKDAADVESDDGCPNFSIYSKESKSVALHTDISLSADDNPSIVPEQNQVGEISSSPNVAASQSPEHSSHPSERELLVEQFCNPSPDEAVVNISEVLFPQGEPIKTLVKGGVLGGLYSDSDDEDVVKKGDDSFAISDINHMTEDISEEERSYTPCLDEKGQKQGLEGLDTELISDEDRNDFDESHELKTVSDGDARARSSIKIKHSPRKKTTNLRKKHRPSLKRTTKIKKQKKKEKEKDKSPDNEKGQNKENEVAKDLFKKLSRSNKERNYRDKDKENSNQPSPEKSTRDEKRDRRREKRKELERYNVRALIADKPRPLIMKDQFGRDIVRSPTKSRSRSYTPPINNSPIAVRKSASPSPSQRQSSPKHRSLSRLRESPSKDRRRKRRPRSRQRSPSRSQSPRKKRPRSKSKKRKSSGSQYRKRRKSRERYKSSKKKTRSRRARTPSASRRNRDWNRSGWSSPPEHRHVSPSWTPPRLMDNAQALGNQNFTVLLDNSNKKKKDKRRKEKRTRESGDRPRKRRRERERTPPPSKEVFASGDNILVSVSFNNENETRDVTTRDRRKKDDDKNKKEAYKRTYVIPSQQVSSPERNINFSMGPKTPPEPQIKFSLNPKPPQVRAIMNPLHEPDDMEVQDEPPAEIDQRINESLHKGPNTPPEPPNSPPSSPDAYDPFEPTKSRSPTPEPIQKGQSNLTSEAHNGMDSRSAIDLLEKCTNPPREPLISMTPPLADIQPADSQSSIQATPESNLGKSPERIGVLINQTVQTPAIKPVAQTTPFSTVPTSLVTSTPISSNLAPSRINILNSTMITPPASIPQRIVLPNLVKSSPVKIPPTKTATKSTPIKPMPSKTTKSAVKKNRAQNGNSGEDLNLDFDSPYSPGSSDYEDLFEPPPDNVKLASKSASKTTNKSPQKHQSVFDTLFGSPSFALKNKSKGKFGKKTLTTPIKTKTVGVKLDEDHLKILDELPNSAVEMQVKDKFLKKLNRQERVVEEVKLVLKPYYNKKRITKDEYKDIMRRAVPKICHNKSGEINPTKIKNLIEAYVRKIRHSKKVTSSSSVNTQKA